jgi:hypothetical protein
VNGFVHHFPDLLAVLLLLGTLAGVILVSRKGDRFLRKMGKYGFYYCAACFIVLGAVGILRGETADLRFWRSQVLFALVCLSSLYTARGNINTCTWVLWWKQWRIDSLDRWRRQLAWMLVWSAAFAGLALWMIVYKHQWVMPLLPALMSVHFVINAIRIVMYGIRGGGSPLSGRDA